MPPNSSRACFNPLNETNGAYQENFFELLVKILNYSALKGPGRQFSQTTLYITEPVEESDEVRESHA